MAGLELHLRREMQYIQGEDVSPGKTGKAAACYKVGGSRFWQQTQLLMV